jgi:pimeloyl-ACP methyl ester carboxylesterase
MDGPRRIQTERLDVEYFSSTSGDRPLVLLHGNFATGRWWTPVFERLDAKYRVVAPTMRGCRGTPGGSGEYSVESLALDLEAFAVALGLTRFHLVGHSLGGAIALEYAMRFPQRVSGLDLVAPAPDDSLASILSADTNTGRMLRNLDLNRSMDRMAVLTMLRMGRDLGTNRRYLRRVLTALMPGVDPAQVDFEALVQDAAAMEPLAIIGLYQALAAWNAGTRLAALDVPTRVLSGAKDELVPVRALEALTRRIPSAKLTVLPEHGHSPMLERPDVFVAWLEEGLTAHPVEAMASAAREALTSTLARAQPWVSWVGRLGATLRRWFNRLRGRAAPDAT